MSHPPAPRNPLRVRDFDPTLLRFGAVQKNAKGGNFVPIYYEPHGPRDPVVIQSPVMTMPFAVNEYRVGGDTGPIQNYQLSAAFSKYKTDQKMAEFHLKMKQIEQRLIDMVCAESVELLGKAKSAESVAEMINPIVKANNNDFDPLIKFKIRVRNEGRDVFASLFDERGNPTDVEYLTKGCSIVVLFELSSVWFINKTQFGVSCVMRQAQVVSKPQLGNVIRLDETDVIPGDDAATTTTTMIEDEDP